MDVASEWFAREAVGDGITRIWEPHIDDFLQGNIWHVRGSEADLLVDAGNGVGDLPGALREWGLLKEAAATSPSGAAGGASSGAAGGASSGAAPDAWSGAAEDAPSGGAVAASSARPLLLVVTHVHADHHGGAHQLWPRIVHAAEAAWLEREGDWHPLVAAEWEQHAASLIGVGEESAWELPEGLFLSALPHRGFRPEEFVVPACTATVQVTEGDVIGIGDRGFEVLHLPGHSPGSIGLWEASTRNLFTGDVVYSPGPLYDGLTDASIPAYCATMRRLMELPAEIVYPGHGDPFDGEEMRRLAAEYLQIRCGRT